MDVIGEIAKHLNQIVAFVSFLGVFLAGFLYYRIKEKFVTRPEFEKAISTQDKINKGHGEALERGARRFGDLANKEDLHGVVIALESFKGDLKVVSKALEHQTTTMSGIARSVEILTENEIRKEK